MSSPPTAEALVAQALPLHRAGQVAAAQALYRAALALAPEHAEARHLLGVTLLQGGEAAAARAALEQAVALAPGHARARNNLGAACRALGELEPALAHFAAAAAAEPGFADALHNQAATLLQLGRAPEALPVLRRLLALAPEDAAAQGQYGLALWACGEAEAALGPLAQALAAAPGNPLLLRAQAKALLALDRFAEALAPLQGLCAAAPEDAVAHADLGLALERCARFAEARAACDRALALRPDDADTLVNRGVAREELLELAEAEADFRAALALAPEDPEAQFFLGLARLRAGDWAAGWAGYEARRRIQRADPRLARAGLAWDGRAALQGRTLLLHDEQGLGDAIQFCRYAPLLTAQGARVVLQVAPPLVPLLRSLTGIAEVVADGQPTPRHDLHCSLLSLPHLLGGAIPAQVPYLAAPTGRVAAWSAALPPGQRVALVASGNPRHSRDARRSLPLAALAGALGTPGRHLVLAQREARAEDAAWLAGEGRKVIAPLAGLTDFAETAALLACCDLVVSVDTSVAHLAGALGRPVWVLLPALADFRWLLGRADSPWYRTARLFRQPAPGDWAEVLRQVKQQALQIG